MKTSDGDRNRNLNAYAVLLAGGTGTRLWPVSRERYPKQLVKLIGNDSLVQSTLKRVTPTMGKEHVRIVCGIEHYHEIRRQMEDIGFPAEQKVICEPCGRNTAPAILLAVLQILKTEKDAVLGIFPADHVIKDNDDFHRKLAVALKLAEAGYLVTFGIKPNYPETGYGYIEGADRISEDALSLKRFVEKPDKKTAEGYVAAGNFFWNSGMFAFRASVILEEFKQLTPELYRKMDGIIQENGSVALKDYEALPDISIDYAVMEKTDKGVVVPSDFGWSDIGSWKSLYDFLIKDENGNVLDGDIIAKDTEDCFILGNKRLIATNHLKNIVVVETPDSVFVSDMKNSRDVKAIVTTLKERGRKEFRIHKTDYHPWGTITLLEQESDSRVERVLVYPGSVFQNRTGDKSKKQLSFLSGKASVKDGQKQADYRKGEFLQIPERRTLEIENTGDHNLVFIQVETVGESV